MTLAAGPRARWRVAALALALLGCGGGDATAPATGSLSVVVGGLPSGLQPVVRITGPRSYSRSIVASTRIDDLATGVYTITSEGITADGVRWAPSPASQSVTVSAHDVASATSIAYAIASARLSLTVAGLPPGVNANVTLRGPNGFSRALTGTTTVDLLEPGAYTVAAADVSSNGSTFKPTPATQDVALSASASASSVTVTYGAGSASLSVSVNGLPAGTDASVAITGPHGFARTLVATDTLRNLEAGTYTVVAAVVGSSLTTHTPAPASQTIDVADAQSASLTVSYASAPLQLTLTPVAEGLGEPVYLTAPTNDDRLFIVERQGRVRLARRDTLLSTPFLDIRSRVNFNGERGMFSMAFDPSYATNGYFYVYYTNVASNLVVEKFASTPGEDLAGASLGIVITVPHGGDTHHGGTIAFGPDGMLYLGPGDGGCCDDPFNRGQDTNTLLGKLLRIDVSKTPYAIPAGNPFIGRVDARAEIWAYGLRNPWRFTFDAPAGTLYIGDVGQDTREEVDAVSATAAGLNFGWRLMEGNACFIPSSGCDPSATLTRPVIEYLHTEGCSVTGGFVYRGAAIPELTGHYLYSDYCSGWLRSFRLIAGRAQEQTTWAGIKLARALSFGRDGHGELYMIGNGHAWRVVRK